MNGLLLALSFIMFVAILMVAPADGASATLFALPIAALVGWTIYILKEDRPFLFRLFISAFLVRVLIGTLIYGLRLQEFFGGDALTYDYFGHALVQVWDGNKSYQGAIDVFSGGGAATAPIAYLIAMEIFPNRRVARACALLSAFFPSLVLWSCQGLKDGPIVFLLTLSMLATLKLGNRFSFKYLTALALCLCGLLTLRFYVFYIVVLAIIAAFVLGRRRLTAQSFARQFIIMIVIGLALAYFGVSRYATQQFDAYGSFEQLQRMRLDASQSAGSGFGQDVDVSTAAGAISAIPLGLSYLLLAPFPWQMASVRSVITLPEMVIWWSSLPLLVLGAWFTIKYKLREVAPILIFTTLLTLTYSILQGNVGTAYRQRAQLLVFYFVFVAVGFVLMKEKREERARRRKEARSESRGKLRWGPDRPASEDHMPVAG